MQFFFIHAEFSGKTDRVELCILTDQQRDAYLDEFKKRPNWNFKITFYTEDGEVDIVISGEELFRTVFDAKPMTKAEADTFRKFIPNIPTKFDTADMWFGNYDDRK